MRKDVANPKKEFHGLEAFVLRIGKVSDKNLEKGENHLFPSQTAASVILNSLKEAQKHPSGTRLYHFKENKQSIESWRATMKRFGARAKFFSSLKIKIGLDVKKTEFEIDGDMFVIYICNEELNYVFEGLESHIAGKPYLNIGPEALLVSSSWP